MLGLLKRWLPLGIGIPPLLKKMNSPMNLDPPTVLSSQLPLELQTRSGKFSREEDEHHCHRFLNNPTFVGTSTEECKGQAKRRRDDASTSGGTSDNDYAKPVKRSEGSWSASRCSPPSTVERKYRPRSVSDDEDHVSKSSPPAQSMWNFSVWKQLEMREILEDELASLSPMFDPDGTGMGPGHYTIRDIIEMKSKRPPKLLSHKNKRHPSTSSEEEKQSSPRHYDINLSSSTGTSSTSSNEHKRPTKDKGRHGSMDEASTSGESSDSKPMCIRKLKKNECKKHGCRSASFPFSSMARSKSQKMHKYGAQFPPKGPSYVQDDLESSATATDTEDSEESEHTTTYSRKWKVPCRNPSLSPRRSRCNLTKQEGSSLEFWREKSKTSQRNHQTSTPKKVVALDCEMVRCHPDASWLAKLPEKKGKRKKPPTEVPVAAHCAVVGYNGEVLYNSLIRPNLPVAKWMGMNQCSFRSFVPLFNDAREKIQGILEGNIVVAHDIRNDLASLQINLPSRLIRDTSTCQLLRKLGGVTSGYQFASLKDLAKGVLKRKVQKKKPHDPVEDAKVAMELYRAVEEEWEAEREDDSGSDDSESNDSESDYSVSESNDSDSESDDCRSDDSKSDDFRV